MVVTACVGTQNCQHLFHPLMNVTHELQSYFKLANKTSGIYQDITRYVRQGKIHLLVFQEFLMTITRISFVPDSHCAMPPQIHQIKGKEEINK